MNSEIVKNHNMANSLETYWIPLSIEAIGRGSKQLAVSSIQIIWDGVTGTLNGSIELFVTNEQQSRSLSATHNVNSATNRDDSILEELSASFSYLKFIFTRNGITGGKLNAIVRYEDKS